MLTALAEKITDRIDAWQEKRTVLAAARRGDYDLLRQRAESVLNDCIWANGPDHPETARLLAALAAVHQLQNEPHEAAPLLRRAIAVLERRGGDFRADLPGYWDSLGEALRATGDLAEAEAAKRNALRLRESLLGDEHPAVADSLDSLALTLKERGRHAEARGLHRRALLIWEATRGVTSAEVARCLTHLASLYMDEQLFAEAEPLLERAVETWRRSPTPDHVYAIITLACYGDLYRRTGRPEEARGMELRAKAVMMKHVAK
jgi:tetratricopeptide (TPR) repeat protein